jgi:hypothetical protein
MLKPIIPAKAGFHNRSTLRIWIPISAGMMIFGAGEHHDHF